MRYSFFKPAPTFIAAGIAWTTTPAWSHDNSTASTASTECVIVADPDDGGPVVGWSYDGDGDVLDEVWVQAMDADGIAYQLTGRLSFAGHRVEWTQEAESADAAETVFLPLAVPDEAYASELQALYLSDLVVRVFAVDTHGGIIGRRRLARVKVAWPEGSTTPVIMDDEMAAAEAPWGVYDADTLAEIGAEADETADAAATYGPLAITIPTDLPPISVEDTP